MEWVYGKALLVLVIVFSTGFVAGMKFGGWIIYRRLLSRRMDYLEEKMRKAGIEL